MLLFVTHEAGRGSLGTWGTCCGCLATGRRTRHGTCARTGEASSAFRPPRSPPGTPHTCPHAPGHTPPETEQSTQHGTWVRTEEASSAFRPLLVVPQAHRTPAHKAHMTIITHHQDNHQSLHQTAPTGTTQHSMHHSAFTWACLLAVSVMLIDLVVNMPVTISLLINHMKTCTTVLHNTTALYCCALCDFQTHCASSCADSGSAAKGTTGKLDTSSLGRPRGRGGGASWTQRTEAERNRENKTHIHIHVQYILYSDTHAKLRTHIRKHIHSYTHMHINTNTYDSCRNTYNVMEATSYCRTALTVQRVAPAVPPSSMFCMGLFVRTHICKTCYCGPTDHGG